MKTKNISQKPNKNIITIIIVIALAVVYGLAAWVYHLPPFHSLSSETNTVNLQKSDTEKKAIENLKENPGQKTENPQRDTPQPPTVNEAGLQNVSVLITSAGSRNGTVTVSGFVTDVSEDGGTCEYIFTQGDSKVSKTTSALANSTSTTCQTVSIPATELSGSATWNVSIHYKSQYSVGSSPTRSVSL